MADHGIGDLFKEPDARLVNLEADVWTGAAARTADRRTARTIAYWQFGALVTAAAVTIALGASAVRAENHRHLLAPDSELAPANLLLGAQP